jgi:rhodanese-related sulfurtransferase
MLKQKTSVIAFALAGLLIVSNAHANEMQKHKKQNHKEAAEYFSHEICYNIGPDHLKKIIDNKSNSKDYVIVDVRGEKDFATDHIPGAINMPYDKNDNFSEKSKAPTGLDKNKIYYIYTYDWLCDLDRRAARKLAKEDVSVKVLRGGFHGWKHVRSFMANAK